MGDITEPELGISQSDQNLLIKTVSVVFHSAATVKFDEALKLSVTINMLGTKRLVELCHRMLGLEVSSFGHPKFGRRGKRKQKEKNNNNNIWLTGSHTRFYGVL